MKKVVLVVVSVLLFPLVVNAQKGCCSNHGGVSGCSSSGRSIFNDGTTSPSCTCTPYPNTNTTPIVNSYVYGCTDFSAKNYNVSANKDYGSCLFEKTIEKEEKIKYRIKYKEDTSLPYKNSKVVTKGQKGIKLVTYKVTTKADGTEVKKEKLTEKITKEPVTEIVKRNTTQENNSDFLGFLVTLALTVFNYIESKKFKKNKLIINEINSLSIILRIFIYFFYIIFILPVYIDTAIIIYYIYSSKKNKISI